MKIAKMAACFSALFLVSFQLSLPVHAGTWVKTRVDTGNDSFLAGNANVTHTFPWTANHAHSSFSSGTNINASTSGEIKIKFTWQPSDGMDTTSDPPPAFVNLKKYGKATYRIGFYRPSQMPSATYSGSGSANNGVGSAEDKTGSSPDSKVGVAQGISTEVKVAASSGIIERTISVSATASASCMGGSVSIDVTCDADMSIYDVHAHPVQFYRDTALDEIKPNSLTFHYKWYSSSGDMTDLSQTTVFERVMYSGDQAPGSTDPNYFTPAPPFNAVTHPNPTTWPNAGGANAKGDTGQGEGIVDTHSQAGTYTQPQGSGPYTYTGTQVYLFHCDKCMQTGESQKVDGDSGPFDIVRTVYKVDGEGWYYTVSKHGKTSPPYFVFPLNP